MTHILKPFLSISIMPRGIRRSGKSHHKKIVESQSTLEYFITYGWAILVIAIVLAILFSLNFFSPNIRALPGSCQVIRPLGPYNPTDIAIQGECTGLLPEYASSFGTLSVGTSGSGKGYGGVSYPKYVLLPNLTINGAFSSGLPTGAPGFTVTAWIYWYGTNNAPCQGIFGSNPSPSSGIALYGYGGNNGACGVLWINGSYIKWGSSNNSFARNRWIFVSATYNQSNGTAAVYTNGILFSAATQSPHSFQTTNSFSLGATIFPNGDVYPFNGTLANVQLYNTPLTRQELAALYNEGIGGAPVRLQNLVGWWPMNGNANDYSGNNNDGIATNVSFYYSYPTVS